MRGQLASSLSACAAAEGRSRQLSSQVKEGNAALAKMREEHDAVVSSLKQVLPQPSQKSALPGLVSVSDVSEHSCVFIIDTSEMHILCIGSLRCVQAGQGLSRFGLKLEIGTSRCTTCEGRRMMLPAQVTAEAEQLRRSSVDQEVPGQELAALQAKFGAVAAKHEEALGKLAALQAAKEAAESAKSTAIAEAATHRQSARSHAIRFAYLPTRPNRPLCLLCPESPHSITMVWHGFQGTHLCPWRLLKEA